MVLSLLLIPFNTILHAKWLGLSLHITLLTTANRNYYIVRCIHQNGGPLAHICCPQPAVSLWNLNFRPKPSKTDAGASSSWCRMLSWFLHNGKTLLWMWLYYVWGGCFTVKLSQWLTNCLEKWCCNLCSHSLD